MVSSFQFTWCRDCDIQGLTPMIDCPSCGEGLLIIFHRSETTIHLHSISEIICSACGLYLTAGGDAYDSD